MMHQAQIAVGTVIMCYCAAGQLGSAYSVSNRMRADCGVTPSINSYNMLLATHIRFSDSSGFRLIQRAVAEDPLARPDESHYNLLVHGLLKLSHQLGGKPSALKEAAAVFTQADLAGVRMSQQAYTALLNAHIRSGDDDAATQVVYDMSLSLGVRPDEVMYGTMVKGAVKKGDWDGAFHVSTNWVAPCW